MSLRSWALVVGVLVEAIYIGAWVAGFGLFGGLSPASLSGGMVIAGGPVALPLLMVWGLKRSREAGAVLWLASALVSAGFSTASGAHAGRYFLCAGLTVFPQALTASLFMLHARRKEAAAHARRPRR
ncbi:MAG: hypothetical protein ACP5VF_09705 [Acidobacteriota bacterium]